MKSEHMTYIEIVLISIITVAGLIPFYAICQDAKIEPTSIDYFLYFWRGCPEFERQYTSFFREIPIYWLVFQLYCAYESVKVVQDHLEKRGEQIFTRLQSRKRWWSVEWKSSFVMTARALLIHLTTIIFFSIFFGVVSYKVTIDLHMDITGIDIRYLYSFPGIITLLMGPVSLSIYQLMAKFMGLYFSTAFSYMIMLCYTFLGLLINSPLFIVSNLMYLRAFSSPELLTIGSRYSMLLVMGILFILFGYKKITKRNIL